MAVKIRYTAARSGHAAIVIPGKGRFAIGDELTLPKDEAERWLEPASDGLSDWESVASKSKEAAADAAQEVTTDGS